MKNKHESNQKNETLNKLFGIYIDWQIDNNLIELLGNDPHCINSFDDFLNKKNWCIVEIVNNGQKIPCADIVLPKFSLLKMLNIKVEKVLESELSGQIVEQKLMKYKAEYKKAPFDILEYYLKMAPWNLVDPDVFNRNPEKIVIDLTSSTGKPL